MNPLREFLEGLVLAKLDGEGASAFRAQVSEVEGGIPATRFAALLSKASRHAPRIDLEPDAAARARAASLVEGWNPERWQVLEAWRVALVLARPDLELDSAVAALEEAFQYADEGEARALYKSLALLPGGERFVLRAAEGCRTNVVPIFESVACDSPFPVRHFDDVAWGQLVLKAVFIGAPLWRVHGLDDRLSPDLARMALDLADERRSAGRDVQHELWLCLGAHGGERGRASIARELESPRALSRCAAALAAGRAGERELLDRSLEREEDPCVREALEWARAGKVDQARFGALDG